MAKTISHPIYAILGRKIAIFGFSFFQILTFLSCFLGKTPLCGVFSWGQLHPPRGFGLRGGGYSKSPGSVKIRILVLAYHRDGLSQRRIVAQLKLQGHTISQPGVLKIIRRRTTDQKLIKSNRRNAHFFSESLTGLAYGQEPISTQ